MEKDELIKSMEICQGIISRMASNAFKLKAWFLVVFSALFTFFAKSDVKVVEDIVWILPMVMFIWLDGFYLRQERIFRMIYDDFEKTFNNSISVRKPFHLKPTQEQLREFSIFNCVFSTSVGWFYFPLLIAFQAYIFYQTSPECGKFLIVLFPAAIIILAFIFKKPTGHSKGA